MKYYQSVIEMHLGVKDVAVRLRSVLFVEDHLGLGLFLLLRLVAHFV